MKPVDKKLKFIEMRAEGLSFSLISKELEISKSTCVSWDRELTAEIVRLKGDRLNELYKTFGMMKEARIQRFGRELHRIEEALATLDYSMIEPSRLLELKLKYAETLQGEFTGTTSVKELPDVLTAKDVSNALADLLNRIKRGEVTMEQAQKESMVLSNILKAFEQGEVANKVANIEAILGGR